MKQKKADGFFPDCIDCDLTIVSVTSHLRKPGLVAALVRAATRPEKGAGKPGVAFTRMLLSGAIRVMETAGSKARLSARQTYAVCKKQVCVFVTQKLRFSLRAERKLASSSRWSHEVAVRRKRANKSF